MKENITIFTCDGCDKKIVTKKNEGFPYSQGWCYIHKINGKILESVEATKIKKINVIDKHFCSLECLLISFKNLFEKDEDVVSLITEEKEKDAEN